MVRGGVKVGRGGRGDRRGRGQDLRLSEAFIFKVDIIYRQGRTEPRTPERDDAMTAVCASVCWRMLRGGGGGGGGGESFNQSEKVRPPARCTRLRPQTGYRYIAVA